jgi:hypothetical protein
MNELYDDDHPLDPEWKLSILEKVGKRCGQKVDEEDLSPASRKQLEELAKEYAFLRVKSHYSEEDGGNERAIAALEELEPRINEFADVLGRELQRSWEHDHYSQESKPNTIVRIKEVVRVACKYCSTLVDPAGGPCPKCGGNPV